ncbi:tRNA (5-methylaminomethyl-2-thiouridine)(34)-methyltransferase MnmD [Sulfurimonas sp.]
MLDDFNDDFHMMTKSADGSFTAYSKEYEEHYHSTKDGAMQESLMKHVLPMSKIFSEKKELYILDICYGLGFNTLATIWHYRNNFKETKLHIYSPELDANLVKSLSKFPYPQEFQTLENIIQALSSKQKYEDDNLCVEIYLGDAREYVKGFENRFDIVYQDAFSPSVNPILWTKEYFCDIKKAMKKDGALTTYSTALKTRLALHENGFNVYMNTGKSFRTSTVASCAKLEVFQEVNMQHKISCNPDISALSDKDLGVNYR